jgi:capsular exopolysaccharide synthesis family protein
MVASPNRCEGKSTIVYRLALGLAQGQLRILVIDADLRKPQQHKLFDVTAQAGLSEFLQGRVDNIKDVILKDVRPGIDLLPNPTELEDPSGLLQSARWGVLLAAIRSYDLVIFDSPAFLAVPDDFDLAKMVDGVLVVAQWGHTPGEDVRTICAHLEIAGAKIAGLVVNQCPPRKDAGYYYQTEKGLFHSRSKKAVPRSL